MLLDIRIKCDDFDKKNIPSNFKPDDFLNRMGLWHGIACQRNMIMGCNKKISAKLKNSPFRQRRLRILTCDLIRKIIAKCSRMLSAQFAALYKPVNIKLNPFSDDIMGSMASQITSLTIVNSTVYYGADQRKHQSSASLAFVRGIHRVNSPQKWPVTRKMLLFDDVIMPCLISSYNQRNEIDILNTRS